MLQVCRYVDIMLHLTSSDITKYILSVDNILNFNMILYLNHVYCKYSSVHEVYRYLNPSWKISLGFITHKPAHDLCDSDSDNPSGYALGIII